MYWTGIEITATVDPDGNEHPDSDTYNLRSVDDFDQVRVVLNEEDAVATHRCTHCGNDMDHDHDGHSLEAVSDPTWCINNPDGDEDTSPHKSEPVPLSWANSASISVDEERDALQLAVSIGDPRGAFVLTIERMDDGTLIMHAPHPADPMLHMPLTEIHPGTFAIG